ncbi:MAG: hypothetical protein SFW66_05115 [Gammaproteobacteria bacterium]|nr:hypothetical protein [Gammaproteobacteria bacterium]
MRERFFTQAPHGGHHGGGGFGRGLHHHMAAPAMHHHVAAPVHHHPPPAVHHNPPPMHHHNPPPAPIHHQPPPPINQNPPIMNPGPGPMGPPMMVPPMMGQQMMGRPPMGMMIAPMYMGMRNPSPNNHYVQNNHYYLSSEERNKLEREEKIQQGKDARSIGDYIKALQLFSECNYIPDDRDNFEGEVFNVLVEKTSENKIKLQSYSNAPLEEKYADQDPTPLLNELILIKNTFESLGNHYLLACQYFKIINNVPAPIESDIRDIDTNTTYLTQIISSLQCRLKIFNALSALDKVRKEIRNELEQNTPENDRHLAENFNRAAQSCKELFNSGYQPDHFKKLAGNYDALSQRYEQFHAQLMRWNTPIDLLKQALKNLRGHNALFMNSTYQMLINYVSIGGFFRKQNFRNDFIKLTPNGMNTFQRAIQDWLGAQIVRANKMYHPTIWCSAQEHYQLREPFQQMNFSDALQKCEMEPDIDIETMVNGEESQIAQNAFLPLPDYLNPPPAYSPFQP